MTSVTPSSSVTRTRRDQIAARFSILDNEISSLVDIFRDDSQSSFTFKFGDHPSNSLNILVKISSFGIVSIDVHQGKEKILGESKIFLLETLISSLSSTLVTDPYLVRSSLYDDWLRAKNDYEEAMGLSFAENQPEVEQISESFVTDLFSSSSMFSWATGLSKHEPYSEKYERQMSIKRARYAALVKSQRQRPEWRYESQDALKYTRIQMDQLEYVYNNQISSLGLSKSKLEVLSPSVGLCLTLDSVTITNNNLKTVPIELFQLPFLSSVYLSYNKLEKLPHMAGAPLLSYVDLSNNSLTAFPPDIHMLPLLSTLIAEYNRIEVLPSQLVQLPILKTLWVSNNKIKFIPPLLGFCAKLGSIVVRGNPILNLSTSNLNSEQILQALRDQVPVSDHISVKAAISRGVNDPAYLEFNSNLELSLDSQRSADICASIAPLHDSEAGSDIVFRVRGAPSPVYAHRLVIASRCPMWYATIIELEQEKTLEDGTKSAPPQKDAQGRNMIGLSGIDYDTLIHVKKYLYCDTFDPNVSPLKPLPGDMKKVPNAFDVEREHQQLVAKSLKIIKSIEKFAFTYDLPHLATLASNTLQSATGVISKPTPSSTLAKTSPSLSFGYPYCQCFKNFYGRSFLSDAQLLVDGQSFPVHSLILSSRSPVFKAMFDSGMKESHERKIEISGCSSEVLIALVGYIYFGEVSVTGSTAIELLILSQQYQIEKFTKKIEIIISYALENDNVIGILQLATKYLFASIKDACVAYILSNWAQMTKHETWADLSPEERQILTDQATRMQVTLNP